MSYARAPGRGKESERKERRTLAANAATNEPNKVKAEVFEASELIVRNVAESGNRPAVLLRERVEPRACRLLVEIEGARQRRQRALDASHHKFTQKQNRKQKKSKKHCFSDWRSRTTTKNSIIYTDFDLGLWNFDSK